MNSENQKPRASQSRYGRGGVDRAKALEKVVAKQDHRAEIRRVPVSASSD
jgi:hypothetical protein